MAVERIGILVTGKSKFLDNAYLNFGNGANAYDPALYDARIYWNASNLLITEARVGGTSDYTDVAKTTGRMTMAGSAQVYKDLWLPAAMFHAMEPNMWVGANGATTATTGSPVVAVPFAGNFGKDSGSTVSIPAISACAAENLDARMGAAFIAPGDAATTGSVSVTLFYTTKVAMATAGSMDVWRVRSCYLGSAGSPELNAASCLYGASMAGVGNGKMEIKTLGNIPSFNTATSPLCLLEIALEGSNASNMAGSSEEVVFGARLRYVANKLGANV